MIRKIADIILIIFVSILTLAILTTYIPRCFAAETPFTDISTSDWYYNDVKTAYQIELIDGMTPTTFEPESNMTCAQAVKLAACMHQRYTTGFVTLTNGSPDWWSSYIYYARAFNIIFKDYNWEHNITRAEYAEIFANALPNEALEKKNNIEDNQIPDVSMSHPQAESIYKLYRAGILTGVDNTGTFHASDNIKRSEVAAILTRMMNKKARKSFSLNAKENNTIEQNNDIYYIITFNSTGGSPVREEKIKAGEKAYWPTDSKKEGYRFTGWYLDSHFSKAYTFEEPVTSDLTLYAKWVRKNVE